jgi:hypothetical protein
VVGLVVGGALLLAALLIVGVVGFVFSLVFSLVLLPLKLFGFLLRGVAAIVLLPVMFVLGLVCFLVFGAGMIAVLVPVLPLLLIGLAIWWLTKRRHPAAARTL